jgi:hypothetical protein
MLFTFTILFHPPSLIPKHKEFKRNHSPPAHREHSLDGMYDLQQETRL